MTEPSLPSDPQEIGRRLFARRSEGVIAKLKKVQIGDWRPSERECHRNVTIWCEQRADHKAVRGWLFFDLTGVVPLVRFTAHSVVEDVNGDLVDITPAKVFQSYPFIRAEEDEETFESLVEHGITDIEFSVV